MLGFLIRMSFFFDLERALADEITVDKDCELICLYNSPMYASSYASPGFILSGETLFFYENGRFFAVSYGDDFVLDGCRVGIDPSGIEGVFITKPFGINPDVTGTIIKRYKNDTRMRIVSQHPDLFVNIFPANMYYLSNPDKHTVKYDFKSSSIIIQNKRLSFAAGGLRIDLDLENFKPESGTGFYVTSTGRGQKRRIEYVIEDFAAGKITVYKGSPYGLSSDDSDIGISGIKSALGGGRFPSHLDEFAGMDTIPDNYIIPLENREGVATSLVFDWMRRAVCENGSSASTDTLNHYKKNLKGYSGDYIRNSGVVPFYTINSSGLVCLSGLNVSEVVLKYNLDPYNYRNGEIAVSEISERFLDFKSLYASKIPVDYFNLYSGRYERLAERADFYENEYKRLVEFIGELNRQSSDMEKMGLPEDATFAHYEKIKSSMGTSKVENGEEPDIDKSGQTGYSSYKDETFNDEKPYLGESYNAGELLSEMESDGRKWNWRIIIPIILLLLLLAALIVTMLKYPYLIKKIDIKKIFNSAHIKKTDKTKKDQSVVISDGVKEKYKEKINQSKGNLQYSLYYKFFMTDRDRLAITNKIAMANGYHRILFDFERSLWGKDPNWIYPGNVILLPDESRRVIKSGDVLWRVCEDYLIGQVNRDEIAIEGLVSAVKQKKINIDKMRADLILVRDSSDSEMVRGFISTLLLQESFENWQLKK